MKFTSIEALVEEQRYELYPYTYGKNKSIDYLRGPLKKFDLRIKYYVNGVLTQVQYYDAIKAPSE